MIEEYVRMTAHGLSVCDGVTLEGAKRWLRGAKGNGTSVV